MSDLQERLDRAERALTRSGFTLVEGAQEWNPPIGPSASPLLERIDLLTFLLRELRDGVEGEWCFPGNLDERINAALAGKLPERPDTEWTDGDNQAGNPASSSQFLRIVDAWTAGDYAKPTLGDYRELQAQHDQLQSRLKATMDMLREMLGFVDGPKWQALIDERKAHDWLGRIEALLAGQVPEQVVDAHPMQPILLDPAGCLRFKKNSAVEYLAEGRLNEIASRGYSDEDMTQLAQLIGYSVGGFGDLSYVSDADYERAMLAAHKPEGAA